MEHTDTLVLEADSYDDTIQLSRAIGARLIGGEVIELVSDLGGGKTAFVKGLALGMGSNDHVRSPSFTLSNQYQAGELTLCHFDFYRLTEPGIMRDELQEILQDSKAVVAIEWAEIVEDVLPKNHITIEIRASGENSRKLTVTYPEAFAYLFPSQVN